MNNGLSTYTSLRILNDELKMILKRNHLPRNLFYYFKVSFHKAWMKNILIANVLIFILFNFEILYTLIRTGSNYLWLGLLYFNVLFVLVTNVVLISLSTKAKFTSIFTKFQLIVDDIQHIMDSDCKGWTNSDNYPFLRIPFANGVNLQWTIRDNHLVNVPVSLLVKGDVIRLRPGQFIFANCEINDADGMSNDYPKTFNIGETFISYRKDEKIDKLYLNDKCHSRVISMKRCVTATVTDTPVVSLLEQFLVNYSSKDAWSVSIPERYIEFSINCLLIFVIILYSLNIIVHIIWFIMIGNHQNTSWPATTSYIILIGVPIQVPLLLLLTMSNSVWKIKCFLYKVGKRNNIFNLTNSLERIPSSISIHSNDSDYSKPVDIMTDSMSVTRLQHLRALWSQFIAQDHQFQRMIFNLGSLTSLSCVDKKGILADPIVTPEKIFIYRKRHRHKSNSLINLDKASKRTTQIHSNDLNINAVGNIDSMTNVRIRSLTAGDTVNSFDFNINNLGGGGSAKISTCSPSILNQKMLPLVNVHSSLAIPVILDMTSSTTNPQFPTFDDNRWERYLTSLKPIGINILLNNCNPDATDRYINYTDNMSAINYKNLNKSQLIHRCFCGLATQIGFKDGAVDPYQLVTTFAACKQNKSSNTFVSQVYKPPLSNIMSTVVRDRSKNTHQLMSQGSADMLLDMCTDYWDGRDISPLTRFDRTRVLDFYNRNIFSSYCIAFAYSPIINKITLNEMEDKFILIMPEIKEKIKAFEPQIDAANKKFYRENVYFHKMPYFSESLSTTKRRSTMKKIDDVESLLNHQIFLGMVSMQADQVQSDVIDCINRLEQACIRFVFFSVDNQLRSRVFAERLGMESGWNCHISLADPSDARRKSSVGVERSNTRPTKHSCDSEIISKEDLCARTLSYSEPILHRAQLEPEQIAHSTTLPDTELSVIPKLETGEPNEMKKRIDYHSLSRSTSTSSMSSESAKERTTILEDPQDHFREDKSKLPCGIKSIRPHLENIDNVPLQVSLFTDCNTEVDKEMMDIMREYGEVICCCGSSLSLQNIPLFSSSNCAVAFIPILHKKCLRQHDNKSQDESGVMTFGHLNKDHTLSDEEPLLKRKSALMNENVSLPALSPINMASRLIGMPCALIFDRANGFHLITFITECHRLVKNSLLSVAFYCLSCASFSFLKLLMNVLVTLFDYYHLNSSFFLGLKVFPTELQIIYNLYFHTLVLALVIYTRMDMIGKPLKEPPRKRIRILTFKQCKRFMFASLGRFLPSVIITVLVFLWNIIILYPHSSNPRISSNLTQVNSAELKELIPKIIGDFAFVQYNVYIIIISLFYMTSEKHFWKFNCVKNFLWTIIATILFVVQLLYVVTSWYVDNNPDLYMSLFARLFWPIMIFICGILVVMIIGFTSNHWEAKALSVEHRLARLYFGTKLGMYSPV